MDRINLGISTCPNDTFIFGAMIRGDIEVPFELRVVMDDVQLLNNVAIKEQLDVVKVSFGVYPEIKDNYKILKCGGALGFGCGPLVLSKNYKTMEELRGKKIAIPGVNTTAFMVLKRYFSHIFQDFIPMRFDLIMPAIENGEVDAGLVIHEGRFTYENYGLTKIADLGCVWEDNNNLPIPLGFIGIHKSKYYMADKVNDTIRRSIEFAYKNEEATYNFAKKYAQSMEDDVMKSHVGLYVNDFSKDLSKAEDAISELLGISKDVFI